MKTLSYWLKDLKDRTIPIGFVGENLYRRVIINCKEVFDDDPDLVPAISITPPKGDSYPGIVTRDGDLVYWDIQDSDLANKGNGEIQLSFVEFQNGVQVDNGIVGKSYTGRFRVERSIEPTGEAPESLDDFITEASAIVAAIPQTIDDALEEAKESGEFDGEDGYSPTVEITAITGGHRIAITDADGTHTADVMDGEDGEPGDDGYSPTVSITSITGGHRITITDKNGDHTADIMDGQDGDPGTPGTPGADGVSPTVAITNITGGHTVTITDKNGSHAFDVMDGVSAIDDNAGEGDTDKVWSADKTAKEVSTLSGAINGKQDKPEAPVNVPFVLGWINSDGSESTSTPSGNYCITDYILLDDVVALAYAGSIGVSSAVFWYDDEKTFISRDLVLNDRMAWYENIFSLKPSTAKYVRLQSKTLNATNPPPIAPEAIVYYSPLYMEQIMAGIVGDGVTDDTLAVQKMVNMCESVILPPRKKIILSSPIYIQLGYSRIIDGNGSLLVVDDNYYALSIRGTLNQSSSSTGMNAYVMNYEADTLITNFRITSDDGISGGGIQLTKALKTKVSNNYIYNVDTGIRVYGQCRDLMFNNNHLHSLYSSGILFDENVNLHQCNIIGNIIMYAHDAIYYKNPAEIANTQINANDIELGTYPPSTYSTAKCITMDASSGSTLFGEFEITGNTIQGHEVGQNLIVISGADNHLIRNISIVSNHISNAQADAIKMEYVNGIVISGNNYSAIHGYVYSMDEECSNIMIIGESAIGTSGKIHAQSTAILENVRCKHVLCTPYDTVNIETSDLTNVDVEDEANANGVSF